MIYKGSCHCGTIAFEVEGEIDTLMQCNCSICSKKGYLLWFAPRTSVTLKSPESALSSYRFGAATIQHQFCAGCGCSPLGFGKDSDGNEMAAINARCLDDVELSQYTITPFDGRSL